MPLSLPDRVRTRLEAFRKAREAYFNEPGYDPDRLSYLREAYLVAGARLGDVLDVHDHWTPDHPERAYPLTEAPSSLLDDDDQPIPYIVDAESMEQSEYNQLTRTEVFLPDPEHKRGC